MKAREHHVTVPGHRNLKVGTLASILTDVARYLEMGREEFVGKLFRR